MGGLLEAEVLLWDEQQNMKWRCGVFWKERKREGEERRGEGIVLAYKGKSDNVHEHYLWRFFFKDFPNPKQKGPSDRQQLTTQAEKQYAETEANHR